jgi:hypothetical protein
VFFSVLGFFVQKLCFLDFYFPIKIGSTYNKLNRNTEHIILKRSASVFDVRSTYGRFSDSYQESTRIGGLGPSL